MKVLAQVLNSMAAADWLQPSYKEAVASWRARSGGWAHPLGIRNAAHWSLCPKLEVPTGAYQIACLDATCMQICNPGFGLNK